MQNYTDEHTITRLGDELWDYRSVFAPDGIRLEERTFWLRSPIRVNGQIWSVPTFIPSRARMPYRVVRWIAKTFGTSEWFELERNGEHFGASISARRRSERRRHAIITVYDCLESCLQYIEQYSHHQQENTRLYGHVSNCDFLGGIKLREPWDLTQTISAIELPDQKPLLIVPEGMDMAE